MDIMDFFGIDLDQDTYNTDTLLDLLKIDKQIVKSKTVKQLSRENGEDHPIVEIAKRQLSLKFFRKFLEEGIMPYDEFWYTKDNNYSSDQNRLYGSQEKMIQVCLAIAMGKPVKKLIDDEIKPNARAIRDIESQQRFAKLWEILSDNTRERIESHKRAQHRKGCV